MNKKTAVSNMIVIVLLAVCMSIFGIAIFGNSGLSNENKEIKDYISSQNIIIKEYEDLISEYEVQNMDLQIEIETLNEKVNELRNELTMSRDRESKFLERIEEELANSTNCYDRYSNLVANVHDEFEMFVHNNRIIRADMDEGDLKDLFGESLNEKVSIDTGDPIGHM